MRLKSLKQFLLTLKVHFCRKRKNLQKKRFQPNLGLFVTLWLPEEARKGAWAIAIYGQCDSSMALNVATWGCNDNLNVLGHFLLKN